MDHNILHGNAVVGQSGGPTAAINATLAGVIAGAIDESRRDGACIDKIYGMRNGIDGLLREDLIDLGEIFAPDADKLDMLSLTPAAASSPPPARRTRVRSWTSCSPS